jgi:hypothetical protein
MTFFSTSVRFMLASFTTYSAKELLDNYMQF